MRISDWSSDVCSSDLVNALGRIACPVDASGNAPIEAVRHDRHPIGPPHFAARQGDHMKKIGFLSFGHWSPSHQSVTRSASDMLLQSIELAVAAEELGADGAYFRVHHFAQQLASPFPLLARSDERRLGKECLITCRLRWAHCPLKKK